MKSSVDAVIDRGWVPSAQGELPVIGSVSSAEADVLGRLIRENCYRRCVETGIARGISTLAVVDALKDSGGELVGFDPCQQDHHHDAALYLLKEFSLSDVFELRREPAQSGIAKMAGEETIDFAFVDDVHLFQYRATVFFHLDKILKVGGVIAFHDLWLPSMKKLLRMIDTLGCYELVPTPSTRPSTGGRIRLVLGAMLRMRPFAWWWPNGFSNLLVLRKTAEAKREFTWFENF